MGCSCSQDSNPWESGGAESFPPQPWHGNTAWARSTSLWLGRTRGRSWGLWGAQCWWLGNGTESANSRQPYWQSQASNTKNRKQNRSRLEGKHPLSLHEPSLPSQGPLLAEPLVSAGEELWLSESQAENDRSGAWENGCEAKLRQRSKQPRRHTTPSSLILWAFNNSICWRVCSTRVAGIPYSKLKLSILRELSLN